MVLDISDDEGITRELNKNLRGMSEKALARLASSFGIDLVKSGLSSELKQFGDEVVAAVPEEQCHSSHSGFASRILNRSGRAILSAPNTDGYGGGTRSDVFFKRLQVFADTVEVQLKDSYPDVAVSAFMGKNDATSYKASLVISYNGGKTTALSLVGVVGGSCSGKLFEDQDIELHSLRDLSSSLATKIADLFTGG